jgi:hypothetical protein
MLPAPLTGFVHLDDVAANLTAVVAVADDVAIDSGSARLQSKLAFVSMVSVSERSDAGSKDQPSDYRRTQRQSDPNIFSGHESLDPPSNVS